MSKDFKGYTCLGKGLFGGKNRKPVERESALSIQEVIDRSTGVLMVVH